MSSNPKTLPQDHGQRDLPATWLSDSKVLDSEGRPLVVHHGSDRLFDEFDMSKALDGAHWFTPNLSHAESFGEHVRSVYLKIVNPLVISQDALYEAWDNEHPSGEQDDRNLLPRDFVKDFVVDAKQSGHDGLIIKDMGDRDIESDMYLPFEPAQIKSAIACGQLDDASSSIKMSQAARERAR